MKRERNPQLKRQRIIDATHKLLRQDGYHTKFSLNRVAAEAGISKGGLMHHFESKEALLIAAAQDSIMRFEEQLELEQAALPDGVGKLTQGYVNAVMADESQVHNNTSPVLLSYLNSADTNNLNRFQTWQERTEADGLDVVVATVVRLACDGLLYTELIDDAQIDPTLREQVRQHLLKMIENAVVETQP